MGERQTFSVGQTVTVLTDDGFLFVGTIISCNSKVKCECDACDERITVHSNWQDKNKDKECKEKDNKENDNDCDRFLVLQLEQDVEIGEPSVVAFEEGDIVFINFCQIIAISQGFPPEKKKG